MRGALVVALLVGCGDVPDADMDGDGIADADDFCQSGIADEAIDIDGDGKDATVDLCPHDYNAAAGDREPDGIPDACDPFLDERRPDTRRCVTSFGVRWLNASYLSARAGELGFDLAAPLHASSAERVSTISRFPLAFPTVSFDVVGAARFGDPAASFQLWLRTGETPTDRDVACGLDAANNLYILANGERQAPRQITRPLTDAFSFRLRATVGGTSATVLCRVTIDSETVATTYDAVLPAGGWGFASTGTELRIDSVVIDSNDELVPFRSPGR